MDLCPNCSKELIIHPSLNEIEDRIYEYIFEYLCPKCKKVIKTNIEGPIKIIR